jgi:hypothetical protein
VSTAKARELEHFELLALLVKSFGADPRHQPAPPEPDVVVGTTGVELTELFSSGPQARRRDAARDLILAAARHLYEASGGPPIHVFVSWSGQEQYPSRVDVATELAALVREHVGSADPLEWLGNGSERLSPTLPIVHIGMGLASSTAAAEWRDGDMHEVPACTIEFVQQRLEEEDYKIDRYNVVYDERWLVFVLGAAGPSTWSFIPTAVCAHAFLSRFDRVFLLESDRRRHTELVINHSASSRMPANERCT